MPSEDRIRVVVDDARAVYPIVIDPLLTSAPDAQIESNQAGASIGSSVAAAGDVNGDGFDDVIVGAPYFDIGQTDEGAVFVFHGGPGGIGAGNPVNADRLIQSNQSNAQFGNSVASAGDIDGDGFDDVIVGAFGYDVPEIDEGAAFLFLGSATGLIGTTALAAHARLEGDQTNALMGYDVASAGDVNGDGYSDVIVGALYYSAGQAQEGAAFLFLGSSAGIASGNPATADTQLESNQADSQFGRSVASAGDVDADGYADVIIGAPAYSDGHNTEGAAFVFRGGAAGIADGNPATAHAQFQSDQTGAYLGISVAGAGDVNGDGYSDVIIGAHLYDSGHNDEGAAFVFHGSAIGLQDGGPFTANAHIQADQTGAYTGRSVASAGDVNGDGYSDVIVGAYGYDAVFAGDGIVAVLYGSASGIPSDANSFFNLSSIMLGGQTGANLGVSVASAGDVNGDGYDDVIMGAQGYDAGQTDEGAAFVYHGGSRGIRDGGPATAHAELFGSPTGAQMGVSVASAGDVNGDGYSDVIIGDSNFDGGQFSEGAAFVFLGGANGLSDGSALSAHAQLESDDVNGAMGESVASAGDVNGDGYSDVIVGAYLYGDSQPFGSGQGAAFVFLGSSNGISDGTPASAHARLLSETTASNFGTSVASAGDVNGDGYADVIVGADSYQVLPTTGGAAFVFLGSPSDGDPASAHAQFESNQVNAALGFSVASAGDVNGDGYSDVIVGAPFYDDTTQANVDHGAAFVFLGSASGLNDGNPVSANARFYGNGFSRLGWSVASAGDVNGDGFSDVIVGAPRYITSTAQGAAFIFLGSANGPSDGNPASAESRFDPNQNFAEMGTSVASAGDVNGDGFADVVVGAPGYAASGRGSAFVFLGNSEGRPALARQRRGDGSGISVQPGGNAYSEDGFEVELFARSPRGVEWAKLEVEVCPVGVAFDHASCVVQVSGDWTDLDTMGAMLSEAITGLATDESYSWRARAIYAADTSVSPGTNPIENPGPWFRLGGQANVGDIRTVPEPGPSLGSAVIAGLALLRSMHRRRAARASAGPTR